MFYNVTYLWWFIDCCDDRSNSQRYCFVRLVAAVEETDSLVTGPSPIVEEVLHYHGVLEHHVIDMSVWLFRCLQKTLLKKNVKKFFF